MVLTTPDMKAGLRLSGQAEASATSIRQGPQQLIEVLQHTLWPPGHAFVSRSACAARAGTLAGSAARV